MIDTLATELGNSPELPYQKLPSFLRKLVAKDMLQDLIKRLDSYSYDGAEVGKKMLNALKKGATVQSIVSGINLIRKLSLTDLNNYPIFISSLYNPD